MPARVMSHITHMCISTDHTGIASGIADVPNVQDQVSLINLAVDEVGGIECRLLCCHDLQTVVHLSVSHV